MVNALGVSHHLTLKFVNLTHTTSICESWSL